MEACQHRDVTRELVLELLRSLRSATGTYHNTYQEPRYAHFHRIHHYYR